MAKTSEITDRQRTPPKGVATQAKRGLDLRAKHDRGGTEVGVRRAHQLADQKAVSDKDIKDIYAYFARHTVDKAADAWASRTDPSAIRRVSFSLVFSRLPKTSDERGAGAASSA